MSEGKCFVPIPKKKSKPQLKKPPEGTVVWTEQTFDKLVAGTPEPLKSRMRVENSISPVVAAATLAVGTSMLRSRAAGHNRLGSPVGSAGAIYGR